MLGLRRSGLFSVHESGRTTSSLGKDVFHSNMTRMKSHELWVFLGVFMIMQFGFCHNIEGRHQRHVSPMDQSSNIIISQDRVSGIDTVEGLADKICLTPSCVNVAAQVQRNMDVDVDPCDDFYRFACGGFSKTAVIPDQSEAIDMTMLTSQHIRELMRYSLEKPSQPNLPKPLKFVKDLYKSCMNQTAREKRGLAPLTEIFKKLGGMPVLEGESWNQTQFSWTETILKLQDMGFRVDYLPYFFVQRNPVDDMLLGIHISVSDKFAEHVTNLEMKNKILVFNDMIEILEMMNATRKQAEEDVSDLLKFFDKLGEIYLTEERGTYELMNITELNSNYSSVSWSEYFNRSVPYNTKIEDTEMVIVNDPIITRKVLELMNKTSERTQANYIMWKTITPSVAYLNDEIVEKYINLLNHFGSKVGKPVWRNECIKIATEKMPISMGALFVHDHLDKNKKKDIWELVANIRDELTNATSKLRFDRRTKKIFLEKIASMSFNVAHPDEFLNDSIVEGYHKDLELSESNLFGNLLNLTLLEMRNNFELLKSEDFNKAWMLHMNPMIVNAVNLIVTNIVDLPAGVVHSPFNSNDVPKYMRYGDAGFTIGHEMNHGFGTKGNIDKDGNEVLWRNSFTLDAIQKLHDCLINQYNNYTVGEHGRVNGNLTLEENIADNGGIELAYRAYVNWSTKCEIEPQLPSLPYTPRQMFWISYANMWCKKSSDPSFVDGSDGHTAPEFRVIGPLSNMENFAKDFKCTVGSRMNPAKKCKVW